MDPSWPSAHFEALASLAHTLEDGVPLLDLTNRIQRRVNHASNDIRAQVEKEREALGSGSAKFNNVQVWVRHVSLHMRDATAAMLLEEVQQARSELQGSTGVRTVASCPGAASACLGCHFVPPSPPA